MFRCGNMGYAAAWCKCDPASLPRRQCGRRRYNPRANAAEGSDFAPVTTIVTIAATDGRGGWLAAALALAIAGAAARGWTLLRGTTLSAPAAWATGAALAVAAVEAWLARSGDDGSLGGSLIRYAAAAGSCCPIVAVLGAKRPQDRGWQWVVLSLWIVLLVPAGQAWAAGAGGRLEPSLVWRGVLVALIAVVLLNYGPTRRGGAAIAFAAGQAALVAPYLAPAQVDDVAAGGWRLAGLSVILAATGLAWSARAPAAGDRWQARWLAFRDGWGAFWGLRVLHRVNETAELSRWPVRLRWSGFAAVEGDAEPEVDDRLAAQMDQAMDSLLWRFERSETHAKR